MHTPWNVDAVVLQKFHEPLTLLEVITTGKRQSVTYFDSPKETCLEIFFVVSKDFNLVPQSFRQHFVLFSC